MFMLATLVLMPALLNRRCHVEHGDLRDLRLERCGIARDSREEIESRHGERDPL